MVTYTKEDFGDAFDWGVSTAAYQIEGAHNEDGKGPSIWDEFVKNRRKVKDRSTANSSCLHYHHAKEDLQLIKQLHIPNYRFSLAWSRILPEGTGHINRKGLDFYDRLIDNCLANGITPWVTLYHWDLPQKLQSKGGWKNREVLHWFEEFSMLCAQKFGDRVKDWMVLNEPMVFTGAGYFLGYHAPGLRGLGNFIPAMHHATLCQALGGRILRAEVPNANIGTTFSCSHIEPMSEKPRDLQAAKRFDALLNRLFIEPTLGLGYPSEDLPIAKKAFKYFKDGDEQMMAFDFDFIGLQNYTREFIKHAWLVPYLQGRIVEAKNRHVPTTTMGWEVYPPAIYHLLHQYSQYAGVKQIVVTENGAAFPDQIIDNRIYDTARTQYLQSYIGEVLRAKQEGVNVTGYFVWTLMDNFEWAEGYTQRFGLIHIDFNTLQRRIKESGYWYAKLIQPT